MEIQKELALYRLREIQNEDMKLKIEEIKLGDNFNEISYEDKVQSSSKCKNNDTDYFKIKQLERKIKKNEIANKRVDNILSLLDQELFNLVKAICIDKKRKTVVQYELHMELRNLNRKLEKAINILENHINKHIA